MNELHLVPQIPQTLSPSTACDDSLSPSAVVQLSGETLRVCKCCGGQIISDDWRRKLCDNPECRKKNRDEYADAWRKANPGKMKQYWAKARGKNADDRRKQNREHKRAKRKNPEFRAKERESAKRSREKPEAKSKSRAYKKAWDGEHPEKIIAYKVKFRPKRALEKRIKWSNDPDYKSRQQLSQFLWRFGQYSHDERLIILVFALWRKFNCDEFLKWERRLRLKIIADRKIARYANNAKRRAAKRAALDDDPKKVEAFYRETRKRKNLVCYFCGARIASKDLHMDHVIALHRGGKHRRDNFAITCEPCNLKKGTKTVEEFSRQFLTQQVIPI